MEEKAIKPWYREPWPWIIIGSLSTVVLACFVTLGLAIWSYDGLVVDDYYKKGLLINQTLEREERSAVLGLGALLTVQPDDTVQVALTSTVETFTPPPFLQLQVVHPRYPDQDRKVTLSHAEDGVYNGHLVPLTAGYWKFVMEGDDWRLPILEIKAPMTEVRWLQPAMAP
ncbi:MAG: FixH family protein [Burkholderiales bacterium]|jgi:hypothetical protein|nr:FixH family protein [Burkholderiales bacterium]